MAVAVVVVVVVLVLVVCKGVLVHGVVDATVGAVIVVLVVVYAELSICVVTVVAWTETLADELVASTKVLDIVLAKVVLLEDSTVCDSDSDRVKMILSAIIIVMRIARRSSSRIIMIRRRFLYQ